MLRVGLRANCCCSPGRGAQVAGKRRENSSVHQKRGCALKRWKRGVLPSGGSAPPFGSRLSGRCILVMKDLAEHGISRQRLRCQSTVFEITQAVTAGWHRGWVWESLESGNVVDIRMHLFVKHSQSQIRSSAKNPIYCHIFLSIYSACSFGMLTKNKERHVV